MTRSILHTTTWLHVIKVLISCQSVAFASDVSAGSGNLRGVHSQYDSAVTSGEEQVVEDSRRRQLYGQEFPQGFQALTQSHASITLELRGETQTANQTNATTLSPLEGQPVYFEKQSDEPTNPYVRIVGGGASAEQRNFCMHLNWDIYSNQYVFAGCGGALIGNCHVLTAAHCSALSRTGMPDAVFCNAYNPFQGNYGRPYHFSTVTTVLKHPGHNTVTNQNDVEILQLDTCVPSLSQYPVMKVATTTFLAGLASATTLVVSGFGRISQFDPTQVSSLQSVALPYIPTTECSNYYPGRITNDMICAGRATGGVDACQGDSGGPLFYQGPGGDADQTIVGIVSWGGGCAQPNQPGVYASVAYFYDWIKNIVCNDSRTDRTIALCAPATTFTLTSSTSSNTCRTLYQTCRNRPCCTGYVCTAGADGSPPTCSLPTTGRTSLSAGRGGLGRASGGGD